MLIVIQPSPANDFTGGPKGPPHAFHPILGGVVVGEGGCKVAATHLLSQKSKRTRVSSFSFEQETTTCVAMAVLALVLTRGGPS